MCSRWPIRYKLLLGAALLLMAVAVLAVNGFRGVYAYRHLARSISQRADEIPQTDALTDLAESLRHCYAEAQQLTAGDQQYHASLQFLSHEFQVLQGRLDDQLKSYADVLRRNQTSGSQIGDVRAELRLVAEIQATLQAVRDAEQGNWVLHNFGGDDIPRHLDAIHAQVGELPKLMQAKMKALQSEVRLQYRTWIVTAWLTSITTVVTLLGLAVLFNSWVFRPLRTVIDGSRRVAAGDFDHRIRLRSQDEMAELARAMNEMTNRFCEIRDDLDRKVKQRTREVIRSDQMASVGFLAAGVAHEINNPLASIAWSAESLESRVTEALGDGEPDDPDELKIIHTYLTRIQDEAFRCKGITEKLLDFSRLETSERSPQDLRELVQGIIDMVTPLSKYRGKRIQFDYDPGVIAQVNPQEMKQVALNLITNALDSVDADGQVTVNLKRNERAVQLIVRDDGCGMTEEVLEHLFEPFFTRRRDGQGTGLGLSITYRIIEDHDGTIEAASPGIGRGSRFVVTLPLRENEQEAQERKVA